jgi:flagellin
MSLGVLNNINSLYAENSLNNTSNSLSTTLQQLSSGSKINSGADDAAGLSLVNGLQANSQALAQSQTNASEGVGLLKVADGALSQVTNLLNRAVTLATEVSNGTLNSSQDAAANQEYKSILSEINNIGTTTTYNQQKVFGNTNNGSDGIVGIYTGDSSTQGASLDNLNVTALSSANVGNTGGAMSYSNGGNNVFIDLSGTSIAQSTDSLNTADGTTSLNVNYLVNAANGGTTVATATITVGTGSTGNPANSGGAYDNTVNGMISAINNAGLGLTASFSTASATGAAVNGAAMGAYAGTDTGIVITGKGVDVGTNPTASNSVMLSQPTSDVSAKNNVVYDASAGQTDHAGTAGTTPETSSTVLKQDTGASATATISYTTSNGTDLTAAGLDLTSQANAESTLTALNSAISNVAAQDGYIGAQINTLNAVSQVLSTQQQNVVSAQNAVQATDYAAASSNMSKYEILSQTGISALAQANSVQQEVTKLLQ